MNTLKNMHEQTLAKQIYDEQVKRDWPGLAKEAREICQELNLPDITKEKISKVRWQKIVKKASIESHEKELKEEAGRDQK